MPTVPTLSGKPVEIRFRTGLFDTAGNPAHAATFIRERLIELDEDLGDDTDRVLWHEIFHFVWVRLGNPLRLDWERVLVAESRRRTRGEAGWSAEWRKNELTSADREHRTRRWREYCCESFCDTASLLFSGNTREVTLAPRWIVGRKSWFARHIGTEEIPI